MADRAVFIGPADARQSYLCMDAIIGAAHDTGAAAIHPGYGFLAENPQFAAACAEANLVFIGPAADVMRATALKGNARLLAAQAGLPVLSGDAGEDQSTDTLRAAALRIGFPVLVKAVAGGGGKGMRRVDDLAAFDRALAAAKREAASLFNDERMLIEKYLSRCRHIEVQIMADRFGNAVHLYERDCSLQRRRQKIIEESPAPDMPEPLRKALTRAALAFVKHTGYVGAGTVEFVVDVSEGMRADRFYFLEMNTRLQVEHPVTEKVTGIDIVEWQLRVAAGEPLPRKQHEIELRGHAIEARICAEDPTRAFAPSPGHLTGFSVPPESSEVRIDTGVTTGDVITPWYDSLLAKLIVHAPDRDAARASMARNLARCRIEGVKSNLQFLSDLVANDEFAAGRHDTDFVNQLHAPRVHGR
jgi:acetyl/propionyl-CoA carboxylase alpha subunit